MCVLCVEGGGAIVLSMGMFYGVSSKGKLSTGLTEEGVPF